MTDDLIPIPTLTDTMAAARTRLKMVADGAQVGSTAKAWTAFRSDLSLILALPDREALARELRAHGEFGTTETRNHENSLSCADAILSLLKGESHD